MTVPKEKLSELNSTSGPGQPVAGHRWLTAATTPLLIAVFLYSFVLFLGNRLLGDPDTFFHIAAGDWIWEHRSVPITDPFSFTMPSAPWVAHEWVAELLLAGAFNALGWVGVLALTAAAITATYFVLARFLGSILPVAAMLLGIASSFLLASPRFLARPHVLSMPILVAWTISLERSRMTGRPPSYFLLPLMTLWANLHGSFVIGLALLGIYGIDAVIATPDWHRRRRVVQSWSVFLIGAIVAALLTPYGIEGPLLAFRLSNQDFSLAFVNEWHSADFSQFQALEFWLLGLLILGFTLRLRVPLLKLLLLLGLVHLALAHRRHTELLALIGPILLAEPLKQAMGDNASRHSGAPVPLRFYVLGAAAIAIATGATLWHGIIRDNHRTEPAEALTAATAAGVTGPVLNAYDFGGYLIFSRIAPFVDGRIDLYGDSFIHDYADAVSAKGDALAQTLERYHIGWTLLQPEMKAVSALDHLPGWERVYADENAVVHRRRANSERPADP